MKHTLLKLSLALIFSTAALNLWSVTINVEPTKDNSMFEEADESNGKGIYLFAGQTAGKNNNARRRALLQFDLDGVIPAGSVIEAVSLQLTMNKSFTSAGQNVTVHALTQDWGEGASNAIGQEGRGTAAQTGDVTWVHTFYSNDLWNNQGGDYTASASATMAVGGNGTYTWSGAGLVADIQAWVENPAGNFGWILVGLEGVTSAKRFHSRESTSVTSRPKLTITYSEPVTPTTWAGYAIGEDGRSVDTGNFLGWVDIALGNWVYVVDLDQWAYASEDNIDNDGGWIWINQ